jgi:outer membrane receptor protein involved in Fe transport
MEGWYSYASATNLRDQPVYNSGLFDVAGAPDGPIILDINNPFLTAQQRATIVNSINNNPLSDRNVNCTFFGAQCGANRPAQNYFYLTRGNTDLRSGRSFNETEIYRVVGGLDGRANIGGRDFNWEIVGNFGRANNRGREPALVQQNFENAVNPVVNSAGQIVCAPGVVNAPIATISSTCAPLNLFGSGVASQAAIDYITAIATPSSNNQQWVLTASISGPIVTLPGGSLSVAFGVEHRDERTDFDPGEFFAGLADQDPTTDADGNGIPNDDRTQFGRFIPILPTAGSFNTDEIFGEFTAEILSPSNNVPFLNRLEVHGAARYVDHSTAGGDWTYTIEGRWSPVRDITFRANYTHAIRAPAITENFLPSSTFFGFATDPCDADNLGNGPNPTVRQQNCLAAGVPTNFQSLSASASFLQAVQGSPDLENERSNAWSIGVVLTPRFIPNLRISADYLDIRLANAISQFSASQVLNSCFDDPAFPNNQFCELFERDPADDQLTFVETSYFNASDLRYKGILGALDYRIDTPFLGANSRIGINASYQYLDTLTSRGTPTSTPTQIHGTIGYPRHSANVNINFENGPLLLFTSLNYTGEVVQSAQVPENFQEFNTLNDVVFVNAGFAYNINDRFRFRFSVDNVLGTEAPFPTPAFGGAVSYYPGILGRYYRVGAAVRF